MIRAEDSVFSDFTSPESSERLFAEVLSVNSSQSADVYSENLSNLSFHGGQLDFQSHLVNHVNNLNSKLSVLFSDAQLVALGSNFEFLNHIR